MRKFMNARAGFRSLAVVALCIGALVFIVALLLLAFASAPVRKAEVRRREPGGKPVRLELTLRPPQAATVPTAIPGARPVESAYESLDGYIDAYKSGQELKGPAVLFAIDSTAAEIWAGYFGSTRWQGDSQWGEISFDRAGRRAEYTNGPGGAPGFLLIQGSPRGYASYVVGEWWQEDSLKGWLAIIDIEGDPESHELTALNVVWGDGLADRWERLP